MSDTRYTHDDPPWVDQRLDDGYWDDREYRLEYLNWLGELLGFSSPEDWYQVRVKDFENNHGANLLYRYYGTILNAVSDLFPDYDWKMWLFAGGVPDRFYDDPTNQRAYMDWLGERLGFSKPEDWYRGISKKILKDNYGGGAFLWKFNNSPADAVMTVYPEYKLLPWKFKVAPMGFWLDDDNIRTYLEWLGKELDYSKPEDWYKISVRAMKANYGTSLQGNIWHGAVRNAAYFLFPDYDWKPWLFNQVPANWWKYAENRKEYLLWLGEKLGYSKPEDWYQAKEATFYGNKGTGFLQEFDGYIDAISQSFPDFDWKPWLFHQVPEGYWDDPKNRRACIEWLQKKLNLKSREDWYQVSQSDILNSGCGGLLHYSSASVRAIVEDAYPEYEWLPWKFPATKNYFWEDAKNRMWYLKWLGGQLGYVEAEDWYKVTQRIFIDNYGAGLINNQYHGIPLNAVSELYPDYDWKPWLFSKVPRGFWLDEKNCRDYMMWLEKKLGYTKPEHWYRVKRPDFSHNHGGGLMRRLGSPLLAVMCLYPDFPWEPDKFHRGLRAQRQLFSCVTKLYPGKIVKFNYLHPDLRFAGSNFKMELDVFLPQLDLAFEYQGEGHFKLVSVWGGEEGLKVVQALDEQKRSACAADNITLIEVPFWWDGSEAELEKMIEAGPGAAIPPS